MRKQDLLESGDQVVSERDLPAIFDALGLEDAADRASWQRLVEQSKARGWWDDFTDGELLPGAKEWAALEWGARRIRTFAGTIVPGLLQTADDTRARLVSVEPPPLRETLFLDDFTARANCSRTFETLARDVAADPATTRTMPEKAATRPN